MVTPTIRHIQNYNGRMVTVETDNETVEGVLIFFNYNTNVVHLNNYTSYKKGKLKEQGEFIILNSLQWKNLKKRRETK